MSKFKSTINHEMESFQLSDDIKMSVLNSKYATKKRTSFKPLMVAIGSLCTASVLTIGIGSMACGSFTEFANGVSIMFEPVNETCTNNGIKMTVISAGVDNVKNKTMSAYITLEDLTDQNRITKDTEFSGWVKSASETNNNENSTMDVTMVSFDENTRIATYKIVATMNWWNTFSNKNTLNSNDLYNGSTTETTIAESIDLYSLAKDNLDVGYTYYDMDYRYGGYRLSHNGDYGCYKSSTVPNVDYKSIMDNIEPIQIDDNTQLVAIGFLDGHLHVKLKYSNYYESPYTPQGYDVSQYMNIDNIKLVNSDGIDTLNTSEVNSFMSEENDEQHTQTVEVCFKRVNDISKLEGLQLSYDENVSTYVYGEWSVSFKLDDNPTD